MVKGGQLQPRRGHKRREVAIDNDFCARPLTFFLHPPYNILLATKLLFERKKICHQHGHGRRRRGLGEVHQEVDENFFLSCYSSFRPSF